MEKSGHGTLYLLRRICSPWFFPTNATRTSLGLLFRMTFHTFSLTVGLLKRSLFRLLGGLLKQVQAYERLFPRKGPEENPRKNHQNHRRNTSNNPRKDLKNPRKRTKNRNSFKKNNSKVTRLHPPEIAASQDAFGLRKINGRDAWTFQRKQRSRFGGPLGPNLHWYVTF